MTDAEKYVLEELVIEGQARVRNDFHHAIAAIAAQDHATARTELLVVRQTPSKAGMR